MNKFILIYLLFINCITNSAEMNNQIEEEDTSIQCDYCPQSFYRTKDLNRHLRGHDDENAEDMDDECNISEQNQFICIINGCNKSFKSKASLKAHHHKHLGTYTCNICNIKCESKAELTNHYRKHTGETPFVCEICGISFSRKGCLTQHIKGEHLKIKPFKCNVAGCTKSFLQRSWLKTHLLNVHGSNLIEKPEHEEV